MTDNYNDDYREVIPEEEKTETTLRENRDNEKNSEDTQVVDTAGENSAEKKTEDKKDSSEYEDVCFICRRPESKAGRMFKLPNHICICDDCMHKTMETVSQFDYQGMLNNPGERLPQYQLCEPGRPPGRRRHSQQAKTQEEKESRRSQARIQY